VEPYANPYVDPSGEKVELKNRLNKIGVPGISPCKGRFANLGADGDTPGFV